MDTKQQSFSLQLSMFAEWKTNCELCDLGGMEREANFPLYFTHYRDIQLVFVLHEIAWQIPKIVWLVNEGQLEHLLNL